MYMYTIFIPYNYVKYRYMQFTVNIQDKGLLPEAIVSMLTAVGGAFKTKEHAHLTLEELILQVNLYTYLLYIYLYVNCLPKLYITVFECLKSSQQ